MNLKHSDFITTPISVILDEAIRAWSCTPWGMEANVLGEYFMESLFLKLTGASEQKLKCIVWDMATNDFHYRYVMLNKPYGECSSADEKKRVFKDLCVGISNYGGDAYQHFDTQMTAIMDDVKSLMKSIFANSLIKDLYPRSYVDFFDNGLLQEYNKNTSFCQKNKLFSDELKDVFISSVYQHRNRCAHNLKSYQVNLPTLKSLASSEKKLDNYFLRFWILLMLDHIFMDAYSYYIDLGKSNLEN